MIGHRKFGLLGASGLVAAGSLLVSAVPAAATYTATLSACGGGLALISQTTTVAYPITLGATNVASTPVPMTFDVNDCTGAGAGWHISGLQSANFVNAARTLQSTAGNAVGTAVDAARPTATCDASSTCTPATAGAALGYPSIVFGAPTTPNPIYSAAAASGMGSQSVVLNVGIGTITTANFALVYTATWVITLASGP